MSIDISFFLLILAMLAIGAWIHAAYIRNIHTKLSLVGVAVSKDDLYKDLSVPQGSNFNAMAMAAWMMFMTAFAYLYFLTPRFSENFNFFRVPILVSNPIGFTIFAVLAMAVMVLFIMGTAKLPESHLVFNFSEIYGFYVLSKSMKQYIIMTIPMFWASIIISAYLGTIYPASSDMAVAASTFLLAISLFILLMPIYLEAREAVR